MVEFELKSANGDKSERRDKKRSVLRNPKGDIFCETAYNTFNITRAFGNPFAYRVRWYFNTEGRLRNLELRMINSRIKSNGDAENVLSVNESGEKRDWKECVMYSRKSHSYFFEAHESLKNPERPICVFNELPEEMKRQPGFQDLDFIERYQRIINLGHGTANRIKMTLANDEVPDFYDKYPEVPSVALLDAFELNVLKKIASFYAKIRSGEQGSLIFRYEPYVSGEERQKASLSQQ